MSIFKVNRSVGSFYTGNKVFFCNDHFMYSTIGDRLVEVNLETGENVYVTINENDPIVSFATSFDEQLIVFVAKSTLIFVFDLMQKRVLKSWKGFNGVALQVAIDPSNSIVAVAYNDRTLRIWDVETGSGLSNIKGFNSFCTSLSFLQQNLDSYRLFCGGLEGKLQVYQFNSDGDFKCVFRKEDAHFSAITAIRLSPCKKYFLTLSRDKVVSLWDIEKFIVKKSLLINECLEDGQFITIESLSQDNLPSLVVGGENGTISLWNLENSSCVWRESKVETKLVKGIKQIFQLKNGNLVYFATDHSIRVFSFPNMSSTPQLILSLNGHKEEISDLCVLNDFLVASTNSESVKVFSRKDLFTCQELHGHSDIVLAVAAKKIKDELLILSASKDSTIKIWSASNENRQFRLFGEAIGHASAVGAIAFSQGEEEISFASVSADNTLKLWILSDTELGSLQKFSTRFTVKAHDKDINSVTISPNNKFILSSSQDKTAKVWDFVTGNIVGVLKGHKRGVSCALFHPVEQLIITSSADKMIKIWSATNFTCLRTLEGHASSILKISLIHEGAEIVSVSSDGLVKVWDSKSGECLQTFDEHIDKIWAIAFSADYSQMYTGGEDSCIKEWNNVTEEEKQQAIERKNALIDAEQRLSNMMKRKDFKNAFFVAFQLEQPYKLYGIVKELMNCDGYRIELLLEIVRSIPRDQLGRLLEYCKEWNTSFQRAFIAQIILGSVFRIIHPADLVKENEVDKKIEALIPYSQKHIRKLDELSKNTYLIDYILAI